MTFIEVLTKHGFPDVRNVFDEYVRGAHPLNGRKGMSVTFDESPNEEYFQVCFPDQGDDERILDWVEKQDFVPENEGEQYATDGAYGAVWDIYGRTPEQLDQVLTKMEELGIGQ